MSHRENEDGLGDYCTSYQASYGHPANQRKSSRTHEQVMRAPAAGPYHREVNHGSRGNEVTNRRGSGSPIGGGAAIVAVAVSKPNLSHTYDAALQTSYPHAANQNASRRTHVETMQVPATSYPREAIYGSRGNDVMKRNGSGRPIGGGPPIIPVVVPESNSSSTFDTELQTSLTLSKDIAERTEHNTNGHGVDYLVQTGKQSSDHDHSHDQMVWSASYSHGVQTRVSSWSDNDTKQYREGYPGKIDDLIMRENAKFYLGERPCRPDGVKIDEILQKWKGKYGLLEDKHGYIQWLFPIRERGLNMESYELQLHEAQEIKKSRIAKKRVIKAYELMLDFYGFKLVDRKTGKIERGDNWQSRLQHFNSSPHDNLRITRILKSLGELGLEHYKIHLTSALLRECTEEGTLPNCKKSCYEYWINILRNKQDFDAAHEEAEFLEEVMNNPIMGATSGMHCGNSEYTFWEHALKIFVSPEASKTFVEEIRTAMQERRRCLYANQWRKIFGTSMKVTGYKTAVEAIMDKLRTKRITEENKTVMENIKTVLEEKRRDIGRSGRSIHNSQLLMLWQRLLSVCQN